MPSAKVHFVNDSGHTLAGQLELPVGGIRAYALFAHCFTCTRNIRAAREVSRRLCAEGIAVLRFDFAGLGESEGDFGDTNFSSNVSDLVAAARWLEAEHEAPRILVGHSLGGTAVLAAAASIPSSVAVATIGSPARPEHVGRLLRSARADIEREGEAEVMLGGRPFRIRKQFLDDIADQRLPEAIRGLRKALLVLHSPADETVSIDNAAAIFTEALHPKSFVSLDRADHLLSRPEDAAYVATVLAAWAARYLGPAPAERLVAGEGAVVARTGHTGFRTEIDTGGHALIADEPASVGGSNLGPTPYGLLSAALAACTSMTLRMYADHKKLPLEAVRVSVRHDKLHARDCADCDTATGYIDRFTRVLEIEGNLDEATRARMAQIADRCPVHRTLHSEVVVETRLK